MLDKLVIVTEDELAVELLDYSLSVISVTNYPYNWLPGSAIRLRV